VNASDRAPLDRGNVLQRSLKEASCAPLELAAAAFSGLRSLFAGPDVSSR
jgi:hypothetical protein